MALLTSRISNEKKQEAREYEEKGEGRENEGRYKFRSLFHVSFTKKLKSVNIPMSAEFDDNEHVAHHVCGNYKVQYAM